MTENQTAPLTRPKRALVLPGGGGRGAYQVGVLKALKELELEFDLAYGTSVGGLNATFFAQNNLSRLEELWNDLRGKDIFRLPSAPQIGRMVLGSKLGLLDTTPLEILLRKEMDVGKLKTSPTKIGLFTTDLCSLETRLVSIDNIMTNQELIDVLMATSAVPLAFPPRSLQGQGLWVDGGLVRNTPMQAAIDHGAEEIFMVLLHPETIDACPVTLFQVLARCLDIVLHASAQKEIQTAHLYNHLLEQNAQLAAGRRKIDFHIFQPRNPLNTNLLEISPERSRKLIQAGWEDAMIQLSNYQASTMEGEFSAASAPYMTP